MSPEATYVVESLFTVALFGGALYVALWGLRKVQGGGPRGPLEVLARQPLDGRRAIYLVRVGKRVLVVGATDGALTKLGSTSLESIQRELPATGTEAPSKSFRDALSRALGRDKDPR
jgi:flagellar biogenesis protein FliO